MNPKSNILCTKNLSIGYANPKGNIIVGRDINLNLKSGEFVCLLGKNGIGKSTLIRTITKMQNQLRGNIFVSGKDIDKINSVDLAKSVSLVLTEKIPASNLTVYELIALGRQPYTNWLGKLTQEDKIQINKAINDTHLHDLLDKKCDELSDGQLQKVMICRSLAQDTPIIILDEPTMHLDIQHKMETFNLLGKLASKFNKSIFISTHEIQLALQTANKLCLMTNDGFIQGKPNLLIQNGAIDRLFDNSSIYYDKKDNQFKLNQS